MTQRPEKADSCLACELISGATPLPGGTIHRSERWVVEHCVGPLGVGTLIVKPIRHVVHVADLSSDETSELGDLLRKTSIAVSELTEADQVYVCLWSHANRQPVHIHFVVQPVSSEQMERFDAHGPELQATMFRRGEAPSLPDVEAFSTRAASWFDTKAPALS